jgi:hypothetical protein
VSFALTVAAGASPFAEGFSSAAEAESVVVVVSFVGSEGEGASEDLESVVAGPEGCSPLAAEVLVADAVSSMGAGRPIDCASFTTSLVTCSAITVCATATGEELLSERCSCTVRVTEGEVVLVDADADSSASCPDLRSCSM